jgi:NADH-quinone oxidoreductase subunit K
VIQPVQYLALGGLLFMIGVIGALTRRNAIVIFLSIELMLNAVNLTLLTFARMQAKIDGQVLAFFVIVVAAAEVVVGLAIIVAMFRRKQSIYVDDARTMKW